MVGLRHLAPLLLALGFSAQGQAYELEPIVMQLSASGGGNVQTATITNTLQEPIAIEITVFQRSQNPDGTEDRVEEADDIIVSPPQMVVAPGTSQSFNVRWVGEPQVERERAFRLVTNQLPINLHQELEGGTSATLGVNYRYEAALYVVPTQRKPSYRLLSARPVEEQGNRFLELDVASEGNMRAILQQPSLLLKSGNSEVTLTGEGTGILDGLNILAGNHRVVRLPWPDGLPFGEIQAELNARLLIMQ